MLQSFNCNDLVLFKLIGSLDESFGSIAFSAPHADTVATLEFQRKPFLNTRDPVTQTIGFFASMTTLFPEMSKVSILAYFMNSDNQVEKMHVRMKCSFNVIYEDFKEDKLIVTSFLFFLAFGDHFKNLESLVKLAKVYIQKGLHHENATIS